MIATKMQKSGNIPVKNILKIALDGVNTFISVSLKKQSTDKNASEDDPILSIG